MWPVQHAAGKYHATDHPIDPGEEFFTVCGRSLTTTEDDYPALGGTPSGDACEDCASVLRQIYEQAAA